MLKLASSKVLDWVLKALKVSLKMVTNNKKHPQVLSQLCSASSSYYFIYNQILKCISCKKQVCGSLHMQGQES